jgi:hypothetical protein
VKVLILHERGVSIDLPDLGFPVLKNSLPPDDGIAIYEGSTSEPDWSWPDYVITVGNVEIGRHKQDLHLDAIADIASEIKRVIDSLSEATIDDESEGELSS